MKTIYLIRHGEIEQHWPRRFVGQRDLQLTPAGKEQLERVGTYLKQSPIKQLFCSPLSRAVESCVILGKHFPNAVIESIPDLREISLGDWEGLTVDEVKKRFPGSYERRGVDIVDFRPRNGESFMDLQQRCWSAFEEISQSAETVTAIVAHAGVNRTLLCSLLGMPLSNVFRLAQNYGCVNNIQYRDSKYSLESLNYLPVGNG